jgi:hypothetical protein
MLYLNAEVYNMAEKLDINKIDEQLENAEVVKSLDESKDFGEIIEEGRKSLFDLYKKSRLRSNISMGITTVLLITAFIFISQTGNKVLPIIGYVIAGVVVVAMILFYVLTKNKFPNETKKYIELVTRSLNSYAFSGNEYKDVKNSPDEKLEIGEISSDLVYKNISSIGSRNVIRGLYHDRSFLVSDVALYFGDGRNRKAHFVGKYLSYKNDLSFEKRFVFVKKAEEAVDQPNAVEDLTLLSTDEGIDIYGEEGANYKDVFKTKFVEQLSKIKLDSNLLNVIVVVWGGHTAAYLSYSDDVISLPFDKEFNRAAYVDYVKVQNELFELFKTILEK